LSRRRLQRWATLLSGAALSAACLVPEYGIATDGSGGGSSDESGGSGSDGSDSGGTQSNSGGNSPGSGGQSSGGNTSTGGNAEGGMGGVPANWSCADEDSNLPTYFSNDVFCGYRFTFSFPEGGDQVVSPPCKDELLGTDCFSEELPYVTAHMPAEDPGLGIYYVVGLGMRVAQPFQSDTGWSGTYELEGYGLSVDYVAEGSARLGRLQIVTPGGSTYCAQASSGAAVAWSAFRKDCYNTTYPDTLGPGDEVQEIQVTLLGTDVAQDITEFDILGIDLLDEAPPIECDGCVELFTPLQGAPPSAGASFLLNLNDHNPSWDLSDANARIRLRLLVDTAGNTGSFRVFLGDDLGNRAYDYWRGLGDYKGWIELHVNPSALDVAVSDPGFLKTYVEFLGIQVASAASVADGFVQADATIHLDAIEFDALGSGAVDFSFATDDNVMEVELGSIASSSVTHVP